MDVFKVTEYFEKVHEEEGWMNDLLFSHESHEEDLSFFDPNKPPIFDEEIEEVLELQNETAKEESKNVVNLCFEKETVKGFYFPISYKSPLERSIDKILNKEINDQIIINILLFNGEGEKEISCVLNGGLWPGGWMGGRYDMFKRVDVEKLLDYIEDDELKELSNMFLRITPEAAILSKYEFTKFVFDPGGFHSSKNRDDSFEESEYDAISGPSYFQSNHVRIRKFIVI